MKKITVKEMLRLYLQGEICSKDYELINKERELEKVKNGLYQLDKKYEKLLENKKILEFEIENLAYDFKMIEKIMKSNLLKNQKEDK